jgi:hypothetical protein
VFSATLGVNVVVFCNSLQEDDVIDVEKQADPSKRVAKLADRTGPRSRDASHKYMCVPFFFLIRRYKAQQRQHIIGSRGCMHHSDAEAGVILLFKKEIYYRLKKTKTTYYAPRSLSTCSAGSLYLLVGHFALSPITAGTPHTRSRRPALVPECPV